MKNLLQDQNPEERKKALEEMADIKEMQNVRRYYSEDEKSQMKDYLATETISLLDQQEEFKEIKKEFNKAIDAHKKEIVKSSKELKRGFSESSETVFGIKDHERDMMDYFDERGNFLNSRRLLPEERQMGMMMELKNGTNN